MKLPQIIMAIGALTSALFFTGCATIVRGSSETISIQSNPPGAEVKLSTGQTGTTPCQLVVQRKGEITVVVHKDGYKDFSTVLVSGIAGASLGIGTVANFLTLPIINDIVDYKSGANYSHAPNPLMVNLVPVAAAEPVKVAAPPPAAEKSGAKTDGK